jgi:hypothetical protein
VLKVGTLVALREDRLVLLWALAKSDGRRRMIFPKHGMVFHMLPRLLEAIDASR